MSPVAPSGDASRAGRRLIESRTEVTPGHEEYGANWARILSTGVRSGCPAASSEEVRVTWRNPTTRAVTLTTSLALTTEIPAGGSGSARYDSHVHTLQRRGSIRPDDLAASLADYVVIDVRDRSQFELGHIPGSVHVPIQRLPADWVLPDIRVPVAVLGEGDADAEAAALVLVEYGRDAITISGGAQAWHATGQCFVTNHR
jgi:rhodanese-related sulfurtransferase